MHKDHFLTIDTRDYAFYACIHADSCILVNEALKLRFREFSSHYEREDRCVRGRRARTKISHLSPNLTGRSIS